MGNPWAPPDPSSRPGAPAPTGTAAPAPQGPDAPTSVPPTAAPAGPPTAAPQGPPGTPQQAGPPQPPHGPYGPAPTGPQGPHLSPYPGPPHAGPPRPPAPEPDPAGIARSSRAAAWSAAALLGSLLLVSAPYPAMLVAPAVALVSLVLAIVAAVHAGRAHARGAVVALPVVLIVVAVGWTGLSSQTLLYVDARRSFEECRSGALTQQAQRDCATQLEQDMEERTTSLLGRVGARTPTQG